MNKDAVFVFGSNTAGIHGAGAAAFAYKGLGARWGQGYGHVGHTFAIPTKGHKYGVNDSPYVGSTLNLFTINQFVQGFLAYAATHPELDFKITALGCGLAGLTHSEIARIFWAHSPNCYFDLLWQEHLPAGSRFWGTF